MERVFEILTGGSLTLLFISLAMFVPLLVMEVEGKTIKKFMEGLFTVSFLSFWTLVITMGVWILVLFPLLIVATLVVIGAGLFAVMFSD